MPPLNTQVPCEDDWHHFNMRTDTPQTLKEFLECLTPKNYSEENASNDERK